MAPMWSSWPWVMNRPRRRDLFFTRYDTSGMTQSMPYMSSPGKAMPQSTTMISPPYS